MVLPTNILELIEESFTNQKIERFEEEEPEVEDQGEEEVDEDEVDEADEEAVDEAIEQGEKESESEQPMQEKQDFQITINPKEIILNRVERTKRDLPKFLKSSRVVFIIVMIILSLLKVLEIYCLTKLLKGTNFFMIFIHVLLNLLFGKYYYAIIIIVLGLKNYKITKEIKAVVEQTFDNFQQM